jgi:NAD+ synthase
MKEPAETANEIAQWLREYAQEAGMAGYVVGLSGGIDSAVTAALCQKAMDNAVLAVLLPCHSLPQDAEMAHLAADALGLNRITVDLTSTYDQLVAALPEGTNDMARANIKPRLRMATLYALAQTRGYLVAGTGNKSELMIGYFTKYGDGGVDLEPLGDIYKHQVRQLARVLGIPQPIVERPPSAGLWQGQTDEGELGISYEALDATLAAIESGQVQDVPPDRLARVKHMIASSAHKRNPPPLFPLDDRKTFVSAGTKIQRD